MAMVGTGNEDGWGGSHSQSEGHTQKRAAPVPRLVAGNVFIESALSEIWSSEPFVMGEKIVDGASCKGNLIFRPRLSDTILQFVKLKLNVQDRRGVFQ
jgi:hypothetical protein